MIISCYCGIQVNFIVTSKTWILYRWHVESTGYIKATITLYLSKLFILIFVRATLKFIKLFWQRLVLHVGRTKIRLFLRFD